MAFTIANTLPGAATFNSSSPGKYMISTWTYGSPQDYYQLSPVRKIKGSAFDRVSYTDSRVQEQDITINGVTTRRSLRVSVTVEMDAGIPPASIDNALIQMNETTTVAYINRRVSGEV